MQGNYQAYAQDAGMSEEVALSFKRFILEETAGFEQSPEADLFRVNALAQMLDRYEQLAAHGATEAACIQHVKREFKDLDELMRAEGFEEVEGARRSASRWPTLSEDEAAQYLKETNAQVHKRAIGIGLCSACMLPMMLMNGFSELFWGFASESAALLGLCSMFGMIGMGVYSITSAKKPDGETKIRKKRFSLSARLRRRLAELKEATDEKARRRRGRGIAMLATCVIPIFLGAALDELLYVYDAFALMGVGGMFAMIGAGVYELIVADGEKKAIDKLLKD